MKTTPPKKKTNKALISQTGLWIGGKWISSQSGKTFDTVNPATGSVIARVSEAQEPDVDLAVRAAHRAFESGPWPRMRPRERIKILQKMADLIRNQTEALALLETQDSGKPISNSRNIDVPAAAEALDYYSAWADKLTGETIPTDSEYFAYTVREPLGVIGAITPWNFPLLIAVQKISPALAVGNTVVLKPAEQTPLTALKLAEISAEAGLPEGVLNVVPGFGETAGAALVKHPLVNGITFTGEYRTGQEIMKNAAGTLKPICFELGGKSANIIFADADLEQAAEFACDGIFFNQGEVCCSGSRLFVENKIKKDLNALILEKSKSWKPGDPMDPKTQMGAIVSGEQFEKINRYIDIGQKEGARLVLDGRQSKKNGWFIGPTVFDQVTNDMRLAQEEIFGPVLSEIAFSDADEVLKQANQNFYGLAAAVWTRDIGKAHRAARALKAGTIWVNCFGAFDHAVPFGGVKMSGFGREGGIHTFDFYTHLKTVWIKV